MEYATGTPPRGRRPFPFTPEAVMQNGSLRLSLFFPLPSAGPAAGATLFIDQSHDMITWTRVATRQAGGPWTGSAAVTETPGPEGTVSVRVTAPEQTGNARPAFLRAGAVPPVP